MRAWDLTLIVLALGLLAIPGCQRETVNWPRVNPPIAAPDFSLPRLEDGTVTLSALRGRVVVMEFWATWCVPCRFSTPSLDVIYRKFHRRGVTVLLINVGESVERVRNWVNGRFQAPVLLDQDTRVAWRYGIQGIPQLLIVDQAGQIVHVRSGYGEGLERDLKWILTDLLASGRNAR